MYRVIKFNSRYREYLDYLDKHISGVITAWEDILRPAIEENAPDLFSPQELDKIGLQVYNHDRSKYSEDEFLGYCNHWYPPDGSEVEHGSDKPENDEAYDYAWCHHQNNNPHHSQYWLVVRDDGVVEPLDIPFKYICEMVCDWASFHVNNPDENYAHEWWEINRDDFILSDKTIENIDLIFNICPNI